MKRRTVLKSVAALATAPALSGVRMLEQNAPAGAPVLTSANLATLAAIADIALPSTIGPQGREAAVDNFARWIKNYRTGADRGHGYGRSTLSAPSGPSPALRYAAQFAAIEDAAKAAGATTFAALPPDRRRSVIESSLAQAGNALPARPTGANLIADFMGMYFGSADATDLAYNAAIGRDTCRGLEGSEKAPAPLRKS